MATEGEKLEAMLGMALATGLAAGAVLRVMKAQGVTDATFRILLGDAAMTVTGMEKSGLVTQIAARAGRIHLEKLLAELTQTPISAPTLAQ